MQSRRYPPILPSAPLPREGESWRFGAAHPRRPRPGACTECRNRKTKCNGVRPRCSNCMKRGAAFCVYIDKVKAGPEVLEVVELLRSLPEDQAFVLLGLLREKDDPATAISAFKGSGVEGEPHIVSDPDAETSILARTILELELMTHNSKAYPSLRPINASALAKSNLLRPVRSSAEAYGIDTPLPIDAASAGRRFQLPLSPSAEVRYCNERLRDLRVGYWTDVMVTDDFAARVISLYLTTDHPLLGLFSPYLFITDLVNHEDRFCSRFLFHALMYLGCQMYSAFDKDSMRYAIEFCEEAEKLWKDEQNSYSAMAGAVLLSLSHIGSGRDHAVLLYASQAMRMGEQLGVFKITDASALRFDVNTSEDNTKTRCYVAWGTFNWNVLISLFYRQPGSESPTSIPILPIPGETNPPWQEETMEGTYLADESLLKSIFPAVCHFWWIIHEAEWIYNPVQDSPPARFRMALAEHTFRKLLAWVEVLEPSLLRGEGEGRPSHVTVLHIWLHCAILDIFRPFVGKAAGPQSRLATFSAWGSSSDMAYAASVNQLKHLVVEYRSTFVASTYSILWHTGLLYLANAMLKGTSVDPEWHLYLLLCIYGYESLSRPYRMSEVIVQGLLSMSLREHNMTGSEAQKIINELREGRLEGIKRDVEARIYAQFMVDMDLALTDPEEARAENLAAKFDNLVLFQDFLNYDQIGS
ncbi:hypothetical protein F5Y06DRAFT_289573 [Hypoxylon sp. FL0890]|nr:hypothetical protein F5Y06DRAFT_289573 [Hypoxylon sp. FL0890]